jgi:hydrogenase nickel incorporation protein HypA/HybF
VHETAIAIELLEVLLTEAGRNNLRRINGLRLRVGAFRMVVPELLQGAFEVVSQGTLAQGATLEIESVPLRARCGNCRKETQLEDYVFYCPACGAALTEILSGKELDLFQIDGESEET